VYSIVHIKSEYYFSIIYNASPIAAKKAMAMNPIRKRIIIAGIVAIAHLTMNDTISPKGISNPTTCTC